MFFSFPPHTSSLALHNHRTIQRDLAATHRPDHEKTEEKKIKQKQQIENIFVDSTIHRSAVVVQSKKKVDNVIRKSENHITNTKMTDRSAPGAAKARRGHQNHPRNIGNRTSNVDTKEIIQALKEGRNLDALFVQSPQQVVAAAAQQADNTCSNSRLSDETKELVDISNTIVSTSSSNQLSKAKRNSSSSSLNSTPSEKSDGRLKKAKHPDAKQRKKRTKTADLRRIEQRPAVEGAEHPVIDDDDEETAEWSKLRCTSERTEVIAERENRRQKKCADYPGLAFARSIFSSDSMMKFNIIRNELQNIMNNQLRRVREPILRTTKQETNK